jgi:hypothetical protein
MEAGGKVLRIFRDAARKMLLARTALECGFLGRRRSLPTQRCGDGGVLAFLQLRKVDPDSLIASTTRLLTDFFVPLFRPAGA